MMTRSSTRFALVVGQALALGGALWVAQSSGAVHDVRVLATVYLLLFGPGAALVLPLRIQRTDIVLLLILTVSVTVDLIATQLVVHFRGLLADDVTTAVVATAAVGVIAQLVQLGRDAIPRARRFPNVGA